MIDLSNIPFFARSRSLDILSETVKDADSDAIKTTCRDDADKENKMKVVEAACDDAWTHLFTDTSSKDLGRRGLSPVILEQSQPWQPPWVKSASLSPKAQHMISAAQGSGGGMFGLKSIKIGLCSINSHREAPCQE
jgi:hypothetical protein